MLSLMLDFKLNIDNPEIKSLYGSSSLSTN